MEGGCLDLSLGSRHVQGYAGAVHNCGGCTTIAVYRTRQKDCLGIDEDVKYAIIT